MSTSIRGSLFIRAEKSKSTRDHEIPLHASVKSTLRRMQRDSRNCSDRAFPSVPTIRTTTGTKLARAGVPPQIAQRIMRHANIDTTLRRYTDLRRKDQVSAIAKLRAS